MPPFNSVYLHNREVGSKANGGCTSHDWDGSIHTGSACWFGVNEFRLSLPHEKQMLAFLCVIILKNEPVVSFFIFTRLWHGIAGFILGYLHNHGVESKTE